MFPRTAIIGTRTAECYTGIARHTKDFDLFVRPDDIDRALAAFRQAGYRAEKTFPHWLGKAFGSEDTIDIIFRAGNGLCTVDELWFERAAVKDVFGIETGLCPPEEMLWMKAYIMERERFDGADVAHLLLHCAAEMDWDHLLRRFGPDRRVLLAHLILFGFIFRRDKKRIPAPVLEELLSRLDTEEGEPAGAPLCRGTLLSRAQYLTEVSEGGWRDARLEPRSGLTPAEIEAWTQAIDPHVQPHEAAQED